MLFIHLSREKILLMGEEFLEELLYVDIERKLPPLLIDTLEEHNIDEIFVLNGPGSFTTLRLGCLVINTISIYFERDISLFTLDKQSLYALAYGDGFLPSTGYMFIGQKKNMWCLDIVIDEDDTRSQRIVCSGDIEPLPEEYFIDPCDHMLLEYMDAQHMLDIQIDGTHITLSYMQKNISYALRDIATQVDELVPMYCMEPQIG